jgi:hypothetical protein
MKESIVQTSIALRPRLLAQVLAPSLHFPFLAMLLLKDDTCLIKADILAGGGVNPAINCLI